MRVRSSLGPRERTKSMNVLDESEFSAALRFDMAAARIAAISRPDIPCGISLTMKVG